MTEKGERERERERGGGGRRKGPDRNKDSERGCSAWNKSLSGLKGQGTGDVFVIVGSLFTFDSLVLCLPGGTFCGEI